MVHEKNIGISFDRLKHMLAVGRKMEQMAMQEGFSDALTKEMFFLGYIHDIGYEYSQVKDDHPTIGGEMLKSFGYKYWKEVFYHGTVQLEYTSKELDMLNYSDMTTSPCGEDVLIEDRLKDIAMHFGKESKTYLDAKQICDSIQNKMKK